jgi:Icc-related predicted phosphoesterase
MRPCLFVSDLHGQPDRYEKLFQAIHANRPAAVFLGGDLLPHSLAHSEMTGSNDEGFIIGFLAPRFRDLKKQLGNDYPDIFVILGNDDGKIEEPACEELSTEGTWHYVHGRSVEFCGHRIFGYAFIPPSPFLLKDWERYDVSRFVPPGCLSPEKGRRSDDLAPNIVRYATIDKDLKELAGENSVENDVFLFHTPPFETMLDRAATDGRMIDGVPLDLHVGSIAVRRFIESRQPLLTLHGHIHESSFLTGSWKDRIGRTHMFNAAHNGRELSLVHFDLDDPSDAKRSLL